MTYYTNASERELLEKIWQQDKQSLNFTQVLRQVFQRLFTVLTAGDQPRVWQVSDGKNRLWNAYDPVTDCQIEGVSEAELRVWLEERY